MTELLAQFRASMCNEHLDEVAALHDTCRALRRASDVAWTRVTDFEERLQAHLDALVIGGTAGLAVCDERLPTADAGEAYGIIAVACRAADGQRLARALRELHLELDDVRAAVCNALVHELPKRWNTTLVRLLSARLPHGRLLALRFAQARRVPVDPQFRSGSFEPCGELLAGLRAGDAATFDRLADVALELPSCLPLLGIAGGPDMLRPLLHQLEQQPTTDGVVGLGLLGHLAAVRPLMAGLSIEGLAASCAEALHIITGLAPLEHVHEAEPVAEDELFEAELKAWREHGRAPRNALGLPYGRSVTRLSQDASCWDAETRRLAARFNAGSRYRLGKPCTARALLDGLRVESVGFHFRGWCIEELRVRHGVDLRMDLDSPVHLQHAEIDRAMQALAAIAAPEVPGRWVFAGRVLT